MRHFDIQTTKAGWSRLREQSSSLFVWFKTQLGRLLFVCFTSIEDGVATNTTTELNLSMSACASSSPLCVFQRLTRSLTVAVSCYETSPRKAEGERDACIHTHTLALFSLSFFFVSLNNCVSHVATFCNCNCATLFLEKLNWTLLAIIVFGLNVEIEFKVVPYTSCQPLTSDCCVHDTIKDNKELVHS